MKINEIDKLFKGKIPIKENWISLKDSIQRYGLRNKYLSAIAPTGSISYIQNSTQSIMPIIDKVEIREQGKLGRLYYPAPYINKNNEDIYQTAYELDQRKVIDIYAIAQKYIDQGMSLNIHLYDDKTTRDLNKLQVYAYKTGRIKTLYYVRLKKKNIVEEEFQKKHIECESCSI